jgi:transposase
MQPTQQYSTRGESILAVSLENSKASWKVALHDGKRNQPTVQTVRSEHPQQRLGDAVAVIEGAKKKWGLPEDTRVVVSYEAGQDAFWIQRELEKRGYEVVVIDPASIPVERHARRAKTDRLDAIRLVMSLLAWLRGERDRMHVVRVPSEEDEAQRHLVRERGELQKEVQQHKDRMRKLLRTIGCWDSIDDTFAQRLKAGKVRCHDDRPLPAQLETRLLNECERLALVEKQRQELEAALPKALPQAVQTDIAKLEMLKAIGVIGATRLMLELFWRDFDNRRQVGACVGLVPQPYDSGESRVDQGISKQGNRRVRALTIEMAWMWLRYQPESAISKWFARRTQGSGKRGRRIAIVAVARRLVIALWRYLKDGVLPEGAVIKIAHAKRAHA